ncbi:TetR/AcrR family transcriptional regulator [Synechococcus sp. Nb3U1]|uniref:TetR/AcrR family transcriptional regulator n=1 Tax=Synechococcus sp. Nb3U1 TaxID=1914529 RepID=UPI001F1E8FD6|nr:TetR/AcrR family transcriptional regulator [Synechococcus sp. Nb3U1]
MPTTTLTKEEAILQGALQEFLEHGYAGTSMDKVASSAGVSKATVYSHFQDKEHLFVALIDQFTEQRMSVFLELLQDNVSDNQFRDNSAYDLKAGLKQIALSIIHKVSEDEFILPFMRLLIAESGRFPNLGKTFLTHIEIHGLNVISEYLSSYPDLKLKDPEAVARIFFGSLVHYMIVQEMLHGKEVIPMEAERLVDSLVNLVVMQAGNHAFAGAD